MILKRRLYSIDKEDAVIIGSGTLAAGVGGYLSGKKKTKDVATEKSKEIKKGLKNDIKKIKNTINNELSSVAANLNNHDTAIQGTKTGFKLIGQSYENNPIYKNLKARRDQAAEDYINAMTQGKEKLKKESLKLRKKAREAVKESKELAKQAGKIKAGKVAAAGLALTGATLGAKKYVEKKDK